MNRYWKTIIEPILNIVRPESIVEVGTEYGKNTIKIIDFCKKNSAKLFTIDPCPAFDVDKLTRSNKNYFQFFKSLSLSAIPLIDSFDVVLIDGDHNWYTVYHELTLIEKQCRKKKKPFPLIFFHDTGWPYAKRDLYYNPDNIPEIYRKPYQKKGMLPGYTELVDQGGMNPDLNNSVYENDLKNGVLTAIDDFLSGTNHSLNFINISGLHGLGIVWSRHHESKNPDLTVFLSQFQLGEALQNHIKAVEADRITTSIAFSDALSEIKTKKQEVREFLKERDDLKDANNRLKRINEELSRGNARLQGEIGKLEGDIGKLEQRNQAQHNLFLDLQHKYGEASRQVMEACVHIEKLEHGITQLLNSRRWRLAVRSGEILRKLKGMPKVPLVENFLADAIKQYRRRATAIQQEEPISTPQPTGKTDYPMVKKRLHHLFPPLFCCGQQPTATIIVSIQGDLKETRACLDSIVNNTLSPYELIISGNDFNPEISLYLKKFTALYNHSRIISEDCVSGMTAQLNLGLKQSKSDYVIILDGKSVVSFCWLEKMIQCGESQPNIGIIGPFSIAGDRQSWLNGIFLKDDIYDARSRVEETARLVNILSLKQFPKVPFIENFCFAVKSSVISQIGLFDDTNFPDASGHQIDYCLRAAEKGISTGIADHVYIRHDPGNHMKPWSAEKEANGFYQLVKKYPGIDLSGLASAVINNELLISLKERIEPYASGRASARDLLSESLLSILFILPESSPVGQSFIQKAESMQRLGFNAYVAVSKKYQSEESCYNPLPARNADDFTFIYDTFEDLARHAKKSNIIAGNGASALGLMSRITKTDQSVVPVYYLTDEEQEDNLFFDKSVVSIFKIVHGTNGVEEAGAEDKTATPSICTLVKELIDLTQLWNRRFQTKSIPKKIVGGIPLARKPKIVSLLADPDIQKAIGSFFLRHYLPFTHPVFQEQYDFSTLTIEEALNSDADILVASRVSIPDEKTAFRLLAYCQKNNIKTVYETDDHLLGLPPGEIQSQHYIHSLPAARIFSRYANMMIVSSDALKKQYREWNAKIITVPNILDERIWSSQSNMASGQQNSSRVRILYMGTYTHLKDLLIVEHAIKKLIQKWGDKVILDVVGITQAQNSMEWINPVPVPKTNYVEFVKWLCSTNCWSIGIAPLEKTEFNRCKSYIKYIDYAALGLVPVCTDFAPYQAIVQNGENGILVENDTQSWFNALDGLIEDPDRRIRMADNAYQDYLKHHRLKTRVVSWINAFKELVN